MEAIVLTVAHHSKIRFTRGWRSLVVSMVLCAIGAINQKLFWLFVFLPVMAWALHAEWISRKQRDEKPATTEFSRLRCYGNPDELDRLRDLQPRFFEPFVLQSASFVQPGGIAQTTINQNMFPFIAIIAIFFLLKWCGFSAVWIFGFFCFISLTILFVSYHATPIYYRISPNRFEVLKSKLFSKKLILKRKIPLADASIRCYCGHYVLIQPPDGEAEKIFLTDFSQEEEGEFIQKLFTAAISPHKAPELPAHELTG